MTPERQLLSDLLEHLRRMPMAHEANEQDTHWVSELGQIETQIESLLAKPVVVVTMTDEAIDASYYMCCRDGCPISGYGSSDDPANLMMAADISRFHAVTRAHTVDIIDARVVAGRVGEGV